MIPTRFVAANPLRTPLTPDEVQLWRIDLSHCPSGLSEADLDPAELQRFARLINPEIRRWRIHCRLALRLLLGAALDLPPSRVRLETSGSGKPILRPESAADSAAERVAFNVSHAGPLAVIALGHCRRLGVDIEQRRRTDLLGIARRMYHVTEQRALRALQGASRESLFFRIWTTKEALLKAEGSGIFCDPAGWRLELGEPLQVARSDNPARDGSGWRLAEFSPAPGVFGALATGVDAGAPRPLQLATDQDQTTEI